MSNIDALLKKYQLAPLPGNVQRLGKLIQGGFDKNADEIAAVIKADESLTARVIQVASRGKQRAVEMEIEQAVMRVGVGAITLVVMSELLVQAVTKTFSTMLSAELQIREDLLVPDNLVVGRIDFSGKANGRVYLRIPCSAADWMVTKFLGKDAAPDPGEILADVVGEVLNIVGGNFKSNICDAGLLCTLSVPTVEVMANCDRVPVTEDQNHQTIFFYVDGVPIFLDLVIMPVVENR